MRIEILDKVRNEETFLTAGKLKREKEERLMKQDAKIMHLKERKSRTWWMVGCYT